MFITEKEVKIPISSFDDSIIEYFKYFLDVNLNLCEIPVMFVVITTY